MAGENLQVRIGYMYDATEKDDFGKPLRTEVFIDIPPIVYYIMNGTPVEYNTITKEEKPVNIPEI